MNINDIERIKLIQELLSLVLDGAEFRDGDLQADLDIILGATELLPGVNDNGNPGEMSIKDLKRAVTCITVVNKVIKDIHEGAKIIGDDSITEIDDSFFN